MGNACGEQRCNAPWLPGRFSCSGQLQRAWTGGDWEREPPRNGRRVWEPVETPTEKRASVRVWAESGFDRAGDAVGSEMLMPSDLDKRSGPALEMSGRLLWASGVAHSCSHSQTRTLSPRLLNMNPRLDPLHRPITRPPS